MIKYLLFFTVFVFCLIGCSSDDTLFKKEISNPVFLHDAMDAYTNVIIHDIFSPPQASRNYVYPSLAAYESLVREESSFKSIVSQLNDAPKMMFPKEEIYDELAAMEAFLLTARNFIFSENMINEYRDSLYRNLKKNNFDQKKWESSMAYGKLVSDEIISWSGRDNYKQSRSFPKFAIQNDASRWKPTPPAYMDGIEPSWKLIRTMVLDSSAQFKPLSPTAFSMEKKSDFYKEVMQVYEVSKSMNQEKKEIASFWDCNPYVMNLTGHLMYATKKITPGGHWMGISRIASEKSNDSFIEAARTYSMVSLGLFDGFISCWDEKYRSNLIRPESVINEFIDENWLPLLQTPPFPEHTSGHSVISTAAATILTSIYGDNFSYDDSVELRFGIPIRRFQSFNQAANEAAISRLYGGIHYMPAIKYGQDQGRAVGEFIVQKVNWK